MKLTKTQSRLIKKISAANKRGETVLLAKGVRETEAAKVVVGLFNDAGVHSMKYISCSSVAGGDYYICPFTREAKKTRKVAVIEGLIEWKPFVQKKRDD